MEPRLIAEEPSWLVVYKPPRTHTAPGARAVFGQTGPVGLGDPGGQTAQAGLDKTLLDWVLSRFPEAGAIRGRREGEGGLLHRLDFETQGLVLIARTQEAFDDLAAQQRRGLFLKEYEAVSGGPGERLPGFPPAPVWSSGGSGPPAIVSAFRAYGEGRKAVRPSPVPPGAAAVSGGGTLYRTEILSVTEGEDAYFFRPRISAGFRHQIRCHLAWIGRPLLNDPLYGGRSVPGFLALRAWRFEFTQPGTGERREYRLPRSAGPDYPRSIENYPFPG
jgi:23S rRNA pseudouridine1911/1915/1917 synthase